MLTFESIPSRLELPPDSEVAPPINTLADELPLQDLRWEDFERLCLRLARTESDVVGARLYGTPGQAQEGIDLYARIGGVETYRVYQCKKVDEFTPAVISSAVDLFMNGTWASRAHQLVLCTTDSVRTTQRAEEVETQTLRLSSQGITLEVWARENISERLRTSSQIVFEFFGPAWVERFCGAQALNQLAISRTRIEPHTFANLRRQTRRLYGNIFAANDPGLALPQQESPLGLYERYITPELERRASTEIVDHSTSSVFNPQTDRGGSHVFEQELKEFDSINRTAPGRRSGDGSSSRGSNPRQQRTTIEAYFSGQLNAKHVVLGGPGSGKSALLRFITLDLLSESPRLSGLARIWGRHLPVFVPFGAWVEQISTADRPVPLSEMLRNWLTLWDEASLWPLVERALEDHRLLLLVDGLDEWTSEDSARIALTQLGVFVAQRNIPVVLTSRPHGFHRLAAEFPTWQVGELAPFSRTQQIALAQAWFTKWLSVDAPANINSTQQEHIGERAHKMAQEFVEDLSRLPDLEELARVPLLLSVLILLRYQNAALPDDRFQAYEALAKQLISTWPRRRRAAAFMREALNAELRDEDREQAYAFLALKMQTDAPGGIFDQSKARVQVEAYLEDENIGPGFPHEDSSRIARDLINIGESVVGIIVKRSPREIGFYHRALQEHLAARHLAALSQEVQLQYIQKYATDVLWRETILALLSMTRSKSAVELILRELHNAERNASVPDRFHLVELQTEVAVGPFACPPSLSRTLTMSAIQVVSYSWWMPHRERLLRILLGGLRSLRLRPVLLPQIRKWFPSRMRFRAKLLPAIAQWSNDVDVRPVLLQNLMFDEAPDIQLAAARLVAQRWGNDPEMEQQLLDLARSPVEAITRAATLLALSEGWGSSESLGKELSSTEDVLSPEIRFVKSRTKLLRSGPQEDLATEFINYLPFGNIEYHWRSLVVSTLLQHFQRSQLVRNACLASIGAALEDSAQQPPLEEPIDRDVAWDVLLEGYPQDEYVVDALIEELQKDHPSFRSIDWSILARNFRDHPRLVNAIDTRLQSNPQYMESQIAGAALVGRTAIGKRALLQSLNSNIPFWSARALLDGWGMEDSEVRGALLSKVHPGTPDTAELAHLMPRIFSDQEVCYNRLLVLLQDTGVARTDFVISGLHQLGRIAKNPAVVNAIITRVQKAEPQARWGGDSYMIEQLILDAPDMPGVRELAREQLEKPETPVVAVAQSFGREEDIRQRILEFATPLPRGLRGMIAKYFSDVRFTAPELTDACREYNWDEDVEVATTGAIAFYRHLRAQGKGMTDEVATLERYVSSYGPYFEERRQVAASALIEIGRLAVINQKHETIGGERPLRLSLGSRFHEPNRPLIDLIVKNWDSIEQQLKDHVPERFVGLRGDKSKEQIAESWELLAPQVDEYPKIISLLLQFIDHNPDLVIGYNTLQFLARQRPRTLLLRDRCLAVLRSASRRWGSRVQALELAAEILAVQFSDDETLWAGLSSDVERNSFGDGPIIALARARPTAQVLKKLVEMQGGRRLGRHASAYYHLVCAVLRQEELVSFVESRLGLELPRYIPAIQWLYKPLTTRLRLDETVASSLKLLMRNSPTRSRRATFVSLLASVPGVLTEADLREELDKEMKTMIGGSGGTTIGFDLRVGRLRPFSHIVLDALEQAVG